ncbi:MAG: helix-turn-helix domain-containing protein [Candidatus Latescibacteria bacterium]|nr:helix-turn-helix domain-containing protein [Candidatus Latescibacterota bacterium]
MPGYYKKACPLPVSVMQRTVLEEIVQRHTSRQDHVKRAGIILYSSEGMSIIEVAEHLKIHRKTVSLWRSRWLCHQEHLTLIEVEVEVEADRPALSEAILSTLSDAPRCGTPVTYTAQVVDSSNKQLDPSAIRGTIVLS